MAALKGKSEISYYETTDGKVFPRGNMTTGFHGKPIDLSKVLEVYDTNGNLVWERGKGSVPSVTLSPKAGSKQPSTPARPVSPTEEADNVPINHEWRGKVEDELHSWMERWAKANNMSVDAYKQAVNAKIKELLQGWSVHTRVPFEQFQQLLEDGKSKNFFETGASMGIPDKPRRANTEKSLFGIPDEGSHDARPIYGYIQPPSTGRTPINNESVRYYGDVEVHFKPSVNKRTTFNAGDSMDFSDGGYAPGITTSSMHAPHWTSVQPGFGDLLKYNKGSKFYEDIVDPDSAIGYIEVQIHGPVILSDIDEVLFHEPPTKEITERLNIAKIPWREVK